MIIIATKELISAQPDFKNDIVADINNLIGLQKQIKKVQKEQNITIYDIGEINTSNKQQIKIKDHINKSGINPIIKNPMIDNITFEDISNIYKSKEGSTTTCCGEKINPSYSNPSHYLCVFSITLFYLGYKNLKAYLIEYDKM